MHDDIQEVAEEATDDVQEQEFHEESPSINWEAHAIGALGGFGLAHFFEFNDVVTWVSEVMPNLLGALAVGSVALVAQYVAQPMVFFVVAGAAAWLLASIIFTDNELPKLIAIAVGCVAAWVGFGQIPLPLQAAAIDMNINLHLVYINIFEGVLGFFLTRRIYYLLEN